MTLVPKKCQVFTLCLYLSLFQQCLSSAMSTTALNTVPSTRSLLSTAKNETIRATPSISANSILMYIFLVGALIGATASILDKESDLGRSFFDGLQTIVPLFIASTGILCARPIVNILVQSLIRPLCPTLALQIYSSSRYFINFEQNHKYFGEEIDSQIIASIIGYMSGSILNFAMPVGLVMINEEDNPCFTFGLANALITLPISCSIVVIWVCLKQPIFNNVDGVSIPKGHKFEMPMWNGLIQLIPITLLSVIVLMMIIFATRTSLRICSTLSTVFKALTRIVLVISVFQYLTQIYNILNIHPVFDSPIADNNNLLRAAELSALFAVILSGILPMLSLLGLLLKKQVPGKITFISGNEFIGILGSFINAVVAFKQIDKAEMFEKIIILSFALSASSCLGEDLISTNTLLHMFIWPIFFGKLISGVVSVVIARKHSTSIALRILDENEDEAVNLYKLMEEGGDKHDCFSEIKNLAAK